MWLFQKKVPESGLPCGALRDVDRPAFAPSTLSAAPIPYEYTYLDMPGANAEGRKTYLNLQYQTCWQAYFLHYITWKWLKAGKANPNFTDAHAVTLYQRYNPVGWNPQHPTINDIGTSPTLAFDDVCRGFKSMPGKPDIPGMLPFKGHSWGWMNGDNLDLVRRRIYENGPLCGYLGVPHKYWQNQAIDTWDDSQPIDWRHGHFIAICSYHPVAGFGFYSWGRPKTLTNRGMQKLLGGPAVGGGDMAVLTI